MKIFKVLFLVMSLGFANIAFTRGSSAIEDVLKRELPSENLKGYHFSDGNILFYSGAVGSVYQSTRQLEEPFKENWEVFGHKGYTSEALTEAQKNEMKDGYGFATIIPGGGENILITDSGFNNFGTKVVVPKIAGLINANAHLGVGKMDVTAIKINKLIKRKLKDEEYFDYLFNSSNNKMLAKIFQKKKFAVVTHDYVITGLTTVVCHGTSVDVGLKVELTALEIASAAENAVRAALGNKDDSPVPSMEEFVGQLHKEVDNRGAGYSPEVLAAAHKICDRYRERVGTMGSVSETPGFGVKFEHVDERCFQAVTNDPVVIARKIVVQRDNTSSRFPDINLSTEDEVAKEKLPVDEDMQGRRNEHWEAVSGGETEVPFDWVVVE